MRIKILKFLTNFSVGGTERQFIHVTKNLDRSRFEVQVGCLARKGEFLKDIEAMDVSVSEYNIQKLYGWKTFRKQFRFAQDVRRQGIQLIHAYGFYPNLFSIPAAKLVGCIAFASVRDTGVFSDRKRAKSAAQTFACRLADCVVANSNAVRDSLVRVGVHPDHIRVIYNGVVVPPSTSRPVDFPVRRELGIDPHAPVIAMVCRLSRVKGLEYFVQAAFDVTKRFPAARFLIVGDSILNPEYKSELQAQVRSLKIEHEVLFTGERRDVSRLLQEVDISVLSSLSEGFSNSLLEAMVAGLPVVATNVGGNPEIVVEGQTGLLVPPRDSALLANAIIRLLESPTLARRFGEAGRQRVTKCFSLESTVRQTEELYFEFLQKRNRRR